MKANVLDVATNVRLLVLTHAITNVVTVAKFLAGQDVLDRVLGCVALAVLGCVELAVLLVVLI